MFTFATVHLLPVGPGAPTGAAGSRRFSRSATRCSSPARNPAPPSRRPAVRQRPRDPRRASTAGTTAIVVRRSSGCRTGSPVPLGPASSPSRATIGTYISIALPVLIGTHEPNTGHRRHRTGLAAILTSRSSTFCIEPKITARPSTSPGRGLRAVLLGAALFGASPGPSSRYRSRPCCSRWSTSTATGTSCSRRSPSASMPRTSPPSLFARAVTGSRQRIPFQRVRRRSHTGVKVLESFTCHQRSGAPDQ